MIECMFDHLRLETMRKHLIMIIYTLTEGFNIPVMPFFC